MERTLLKKTGLRGSASKYFRKRTIKLSTVRVENFVGIAPSQFKQFFARQRLSRVAQKKLQKFGLLFG